MGKWRKSIISSNPESKWNGQLIALWYTCSYNDNIDPRVLSILMLSISLISVCHPIDIDTETVVPLKRRKTESRNIFYRSPVGRRGWGRRLLLIDIIGEINEQHLSYYSKWIELVYKYKPFWHVNNKSPDTVWSIVQCRPFTRDFQTNSNDYEE